MSHLLACEAGFQANGKPWFKAFATLSGLMGGSYTCPHTQGKVPFMTFHGDDDNIVGIDGRGTLNMIFKSLSVVVAEWTVLID